MQASCVMVRGTFTHGAVVPTPRGLAPGAEVVKVALVPVPVLVLNMLKMKD